MRNKTKTTQKMPTRTESHAVQSPGLGSQIASTLFQGFAFGIGSSVARNTVDRVMNSPPIPVQSEPVKCKDIWKQYNDCIESSTDCQHYIEQLSKCINSNK